MPLEILETPIVVNNLFASPPIVNKSANVAVVYFDFGSLTVMTAGHELGHGYGLQHAENTTSGDYGDFWDVMGNPLGGRTNFYNLNFDHASNRNSPPATGGESGPSLNAQHLNFLGWLPAANQFVYDTSYASPVTLTLTALGHPAGAGYLDVRIPPWSSTTYPPGYTVEFRSNSAWDQNVPASVIIHAGWSPQGYAETFSIRKWTFTVVS